MGIICEACGRDIDALGQDNMGVDAPLCEDCWSERQSHAVAALKRENTNLRRRNESLDKDRKALELRLAETNRRLRVVLDAAAEEATAPKATKLAAGAVKDARLSIETVYKVSRERALALTTLDECEMWLGRCEPKETAAPTLEGAAQDAAMPCLKGDGAHGFAMPDVSVEINAEKVAETVAKSLRESVQPALRMAVE